MVPIIVILTFVVFVLVDVGLRLILKRLAQARLRRERQQALDIGLRLEFADEARSLRRVEMKDPKARILAVDDEPIVLDSFRKILVLAGFSIDTVETGQEALTLVRRNDYDFVFTDLKMPGMDGLDVTKAVKHLRPDIDVVMITGYATIESAVDAMKYGSMDYVQKPFTEDELVAFANQCLIRRQVRIEELTPPRVHLVTPSSGQSTSDHVVNVPGGVFVSPEHTWVGVEITGEARVGLDDFALKALGEPEEIEFPRAGSRVKRGEALFSIRREGVSLTYTTPVSGRVSRVNHELTYQLDLLRRRPFQMGWICALEPTALSTDLESLTVGADAVSWYEEEIQRFWTEVRKLAREAEPGRPVDAGGSGVDRWNAFAKLFLHSARAAAVA